MTTRTKTAECRKTAKTKTTDLVCVCGKRLTVSVPREGWRMSLIATALANRWKIEDAYEVDFGPEIDAYCPNCHSGKIQRHD